MAINIHRARVLLVLLAAGVLTAGLLALVGATPARAAERSFAPAPSSPFSVGSTPTTVTNADFNGDGQADLAISNYDSDDVSVLLSNGDGTFQAKQDFAAGDGPTSVNSADFNKDGIADLAVSNQDSNKVSILLGEDDGTGKGDGTFQTPQNFPVGSIPSSVASADFNGDDKADLAVSNYGNHTVSVLLGNGDGTFQAKQDYGVSVAGVNPNEVITADFNGDGKMDLATANIGTELSIALGGVAVLLGNGDGTFKAASKAVTQAFNTSVATADFNGDGKKDLVATGPVCCALGKVSVALGNGDGTFQAKQEFRVGNGHTAPRSVSSADFDKDGNQDLAVSNGANSVSLLWGSGNGSFVQPSQEFPAGNGPIFVIGADFNADSYADLAVANQNSNNVSVLLNTPRPDTTAPSTTGTLSPEPNAAGWNKEDVTLTLSATDDDSGVKELTYSATGAQPLVEQTVQGSSATLPTITTEGETTITYHATDNAGNSEVEKTFTVKLDKSAPTSSATAKDSGGNGYTSGTLTSKNVTVELNTADGSGSGVKGIAYSINGGASKTYNPTEKILISSEGVSTISYFATDSAGNQESPAKTFTVKLDKSAPTLDPTNTDSVEPNNRATGVSRDVKPEATFSDEMDSASLTTSTVKLYQRKSGKWRPVRDTKVSCDDPCHTVTLDPYPTDPSKLLVANKKFKVTVTTGAKNLAGLPLSSSKSWTFTTGE